MVILIGNYIPLKIQFQLNFTRLHVHASKYSKKSVKWIHDSEFLISLCYTCINIKLTLVNHSWHKYCVYGSQDRVVCTLTRLWTGRSRVWFLTRARDVFLHNIQTSCGFHLASCSVPSGNKAAGAWSWPLLSTARVRTEWSCTLAPNVCHCDVVRDFTFTCYAHYFINGIQPHVSDVHCQFSYN